MLDIIKPFLLIYEEQQTRLCQRLIWLLVAGDYVAHRSHEVT